MNSHLTPIPAKTDSQRADLFADVDLVVFDFDGVVADSEVISLSTLRDTLGSYGIAMSLDEVRETFLGKSLKTIMGHVAAHHRAGDAATFGEAWQSALYAQFRATLAPMTGLQELLNDLTAQGTAFCIASSSTFERINVALSAMALKDAFADVFSAEQVAQGKPAPDLFLLAASSMGVDPQRCLVVEDSPYGIRAAQAAGMRSVGFVGGTHLQDIAQDHGEMLLEKGADTILTSHLDLAAQITAGRT